MEKIDQKNLPKQLMEIPDPPKFLYIKGLLPGYNIEADENFRFLTIVGARKNTPYGEEVCRKIIAGLKGYPISIVSGLAIGIDSIVHEAAIEANLHTIAFPGSGLSEKNIYPRKNAGLVQKILKNGGCLLSEFDPNEKARPYFFPKRNRLMAGISHATLIIESSKKSGTLITARLCADYNRELAVVPGSIFSEKSAGSHQFLKLGAHPVCSAEDILEILGFEASPDQKIKNLSPKQKSLFESLSDGENFDKLSQKSGLKPNELNLALSELELAGMIKNLGGTYFKNLH